MLSGENAGTEVVTLKLSWEMQDRRKSRDSLALLEHGAPSHLKYHHHDSHVAFHTLVRFVSGGP